MKAAHLLVKTAWRSLLIRARGFGGTVLDLIYPPGCMVCGRDVDAKEWICQACDESLPRLTGRLCKRCSLPLEGHFVGPFECPNCRDHIPAFETAVSAMRARGAVRELIHRFKYDSASSLAVPLGQWLREALLDGRLELIHPETLLVPVPLHPVRIRERGYNQSELLAREISRAEGLHLANILERTRATRTQTALDRREREENLDGAFRLRSGANVRDREILLVDDVLTTGSTIDACAKVLKSAGAYRVRAVTVARA